MNKVLEFVRNTSNTELQRIVREVLDTQDVFVKARNQYGETYVFLFGRANHTYDDYPPNPYISLCLSGDHFIPSAQRMWLGLGLEEVEYSLQRRAGLTEEMTGEQQFRAIYSYFKDKYRKPVSTGCVKAFTNLSRLAWLSKRPSSANVAALGDEHFVINQYSNDFVRVSNEEGEVRWILATTSDGTNWSNLPEYAGFASVMIRQDGGNSYYIFVPPSQLIPVYASYSRITDQLGPVVSNVHRPTAERMEGQFRQVTRPNGDVVFVQRRRTGGNYNTTPMFGYSTRIENVLEDDDLFRLGKVDLYKRRPLSEVPFLGWELEACDNQSSEGVNVGAPNKMRELLDRVIMCKSDSSITPAGFETVSIPATLDFWKETSLSSAMNTLRQAPYNMRSYENGSCGFHVHVSRSALSVLDLQKLERFMHGAENRTFLEKVAGRNACTYANYYPEMFTGKDRKLRTAQRTSSFRASTMDPVLQRSNPVSASYLEQLWGDTYHVDSTFVYFCRMLSSSFYIATLRRGVENLLTEEEGLKFTNTIKSVKSGLSSFNSFSCLSEEQLVEVCRKIAVFHPDIRAKNTMRLVLAQVYPTRLFDFLDVPSTPSKDDWRAGTRKSDKSFKRADNYTVCRSLPGPIGKAAAGRYDVLNTTGQNTVEFRLFKGTMNPDSIFRYLEFVDALVRFLPTTSATDAGLSYVKFLEWLMGDSFNVLRYENLVAFCVKNQLVERKKVRRRELKVPLENDGFDGAPSEIKEDEDDEDMDYYTDDDCECEDCRPDLHE